MRQQPLPLVDDAPAERRAVALYIRCEPSTLRRLKAKAKRLGISSSMFVRLALVHALTFDVVQVGSRRP